MKVEVPPALTELPAIGTNELARAWVRLTVTTLALSTEVDATATSKEREQVKGMAHKSFAAQI